MTVCQENKYLTDEKCDLDAPSVELLLWFLELAGLLASSVI